MGVETSGQECLKPLDAVRQFFGPIHIQREKRLLRVQVTAYDTMLGTNISLLFAKQSWQLRIYYGRFPGGLARQKL